VSQLLGAQSWNLNYSTATTTEQIMALSAPSDDVCWFITNFDNLYKTNDGGALWVKIPPTALSFNPSGLYVIDENTAFKSSNQNLYRTTDGGLHWSLAFTGTQFSPPVVQMKDASIGVVASGGILHKTSDGGVSWNSTVAQPPLNIQNTSGKGSVFNLGDELWVTQQSGGIAYSPDFGNSWSTPSNIGFTSTGVNTRISFANTNFGIATKGSVSPFVYVTNDGGNNWSNTDNSLGANEDVVADGTELWYIPNPADHFYIKNSTDGGALWQIQLQLSGNEGFNVLEKSRSGHRLWAGTSKGKLYQYVPLLSSEDFTRDKIKIYPNPASDFIYFNSESLRNVVIYNSLGKVVASKQINDSHDAFLDVSALAHGIYIAEFTSVFEKQQRAKLIIQN
jgi:hypothetical protein